MDHQQIRNLYSLPEVKKGMRLYLSINRREKSHLRIFQKKVSVHLPFRYAVFLWLGVLASYCYYKKLPHTQCLRATLIYYLILLLLISLKWVLWAKIKGCVPSGNSREKSASLSLLASRGYPHSLACGHTTPTKASIVTSSLTLTLLPTSYKNLCDYIGSPWIISPSQDPYVNNTAKSLSLYKTSYSQIPGFKMYRTLFGTIVLPTTLGGEIQRLKLEAG